MQNSIQKAMRVYYDFHIHSALSPCADDSMTPYNIIRMAKLKGLDVIAIADHNCILNIKPALKAAKENNITLIPAMELETSEEIHLLCLFTDYLSCESFYNYISKDFPKIKNDEDIFGPQYIFDESDNIKGKYEYLLSTASKISIYDAICALNKIGAVGIPSHIDRESNSIISNLGLIPEDLEISCIEIMDKNKLTSLKSKYKTIEDLNIIINSDAHNLGQINERNHFIEVECCNNIQILKKIKEKSAVF